MILFLTNQEKYQSESSISNDGNEDSKDTFNPHTVASFSNTLGRVAASISFIELRTAVIELFLMSSSHEVPRIKGGAIFVSVDINLAIVSVYPLFRFSAFKISGRNIPGVLKSVLNVGTGSNNRAG